MAISRYRLPVLALPLSLSLSACGGMGYGTPQLSPPDTETYAAAQGIAAQNMAPALARPAAAGPSLYAASAASTSLFTDLRARQLGDIVTVQVDIDDSADYSNTTTRSRNTSKSGGIGAFFGLEKVVNDLIGLDTSNMLDTNSSSNNNGVGTSSRNEKVSMSLAGTVVAVLPNGNLVIKAKQEARVGNELRELIVMGLVRPTDISRNNVIQHDRIADMRMSYGGKGQLTAQQQAAWGQELIEAFSPF